MNAWFRVYVQVPKKRLPRLKRAHAGREHRCAMRDPPIRECKADSVEDVKRQKQSKRSSNKPRAVDKRQIDQIRLS